MKQIVLSTPEAQVVNVNNFEFDDQKYYGLLIKGGQKGIVAKNKYYDGVFEAVAVQGLTRRNGWSWSGKTLKDCIKEVLRGDENNKVFVFDTPRELFLWLAE